MTTTTQLQFVSRARVKETPVAIIRRWRSKCDRYAVQQVDPLFRKRSNGRPARYFLAVQVVSHADQRQSEMITSRHHSKEAAVRACQKHHRRTQ